MAKKQKFTFIDLFAGIGGMRLAYESAGGKCVYSSEWNKYSQQTYKANFGDEPDGDITKVDAEKDIPDHDILVAGRFPLQEYLKNKVWEELQVLKIKLREHFSLMCVAF